MRRRFALALLAAAFLVGPGRVALPQTPPPAEGGENRDLLEMLERARRGGAQAEKMEAYRKQLLEGAEWVWLTAAALVAVPIAFFLLRFLYNLTLGAAAAEVRRRGTGKSRTVPVDEGIKARAERLAKEGHALEAAQLFADVGARDRSLDVLRKAGEWSAAADLAEQFGRPAEAAEIYGRLKNFGRAAELYEGAKDFLKAAAAWQAAGRDEAAARALARGGRHGDAAERFLRMDDPLRAAIEYEKAGETARAADLYVRAVQSGERYVGSAEFDPTKIARTLERVRRFEQAAEVYIGSQQLTEAIGLYLRVGNLEKATRLYCDSGGGVGDALLLSSGGGRGIDPERLLGLLLEAKDFERAGRLCETLGRWKEAGEAFERGGAFVRAGRAFARSGEKERAASAFARGGQSDRVMEIRLERGDKVGAAEAALSSGEFLKAGRWLLEAGERERATEVLQRVPPDASDAAAAQELLRGVVTTLRREHLLIEEEGFAAAVRAETTPAPPAAEGGRATPPGESILARQEGVDLLRNVGAFRALSLPILKGLAEAAERKKYGPGEVILGEGVDGVGIYVIREGVVGVYKKMGESNGRIALLSAGEHFAEMSLLEGAKTSAEIRAEEPTECLFIRRDNFSTRVESNPVAAAQVYREFAVTLSRRLRTTSEEMIRLRIG